jgi:deazaflavin-dependent oxidoreductase (nitroreductase family)
MSTDTINGNPSRRPSSAPTVETQSELAVAREAVHHEVRRDDLAHVVAPVEAPPMKASRGRIRVSFSAPVVVLTSIGARSGERRAIPLTYFTDGDAVILIASNYGGPRHPAWYHNLLAHPQCELHLGTCGGRFIAEEARGSDRDRLYALATDRLNQAFALYGERSGARTIPVMRLRPSQQNSWSLGDSNP